MIAVIKSQNAILADHSRAEIHRLYESEGDGKLFMEGK
jgi:hypothetical protein